MQFTHGTDGFTKTEASQINPFNRAVGNCCDNNSSSIKHKKVAKPAWLWLLNCSLRCAHAPCFYRWEDKLLASWLQRQTLRRLWSSSVHYLSSPVLKCYYFSQHCAYLPGKNETGSSHFKQQEVAVCTVSLHKSQAIYNSSKLNPSYSWSPVIKSAFLFGQSPCSWNISSKVSFLRKTVRHTILNSLKQILLNATKHHLAPQAPQRMEKHMAKTLAWTVHWSSIIMIPLQVP